MDDSTENTTHQNTPADDFIENSYNELVNINQRLDKAYDLSNAAWDVDMLAGIIRFTLTNNEILEANIQVIGTYDTIENTFMWGWDHPSIPLALQRTALLTQEWGIEHAKPIFSTQVVEVPEQMAWYFTAVGLKLSDAAGVYRGVTGSTYVFMILDNFEKR